MGQAMIVELDSVNKGYLDGDDGARREILIDVSLQVEQGERISVIGHSGCGKSTLLNLMGLLDVPDSGAIFLNGKDTLRMSEKESSETRANDIGFVFQQHHLLPQATVLENVTLPSLALSKKADPGIVKARALELLAEVGIVDHANKLPGKLSGGERQRAAVVRALINKPSLLLADEPTGALDSERSHELAGLLLELNRSEGTALVMVTHNHDIAAMMDRRLTIQSGTLQDDS
ncbi:MAG: ABC transporter ATP-binding protein [Verrucomicrobiaceae bacterium]|nr:ABC transporter ATP-binding protein [Verrucomicrobiaceae bacterium]